MSSNDLSFYLEYFKFNQDNKTTYSNYSNNLPSYGLMPYEYSFRNTFEYNLPTSNNFNYNGGYTCKDKLGHPALCMPNDLDEFSKAMNELNDNYYNFDKYDNIFDEIVFSKEISPTEKQNIGYPSYWFNNQYDYHLT